MKKGFQEILVAAIQLIILGALAWLFIAQVFSLFDMIDEQIIKSLNRG